MLSVCDIEPAERWILDGAEKTGKAPATITFPLARVRECSAREAEVLAYEEPGKSRSVVLRKVMCRVAPGAEDKAPEETPKAEASRDVSKHGESIKISTFEIIKIQAEKILSERHLYFMRNNTEVTAFVDDFSKDLVFTLCARLLAKTYVDKEKGEVTIVCHEDADWWQSFRKRWFPGWWLKKHPIKTVEVKHSAPFEKTITIYNICPHIDMKVPDDRQHYAFMERDPRDDRPRLRDYPAS